jgi:hypothetical protein
MVITYTETPTYVTRVSALTGERDSLFKELTSLADAKRGTPGTADRRAKIRARLKTVENNLQHGLSDLTWPQIFNVWIETRVGEEGGLWTPEQLDLIKPDTLYYEGVTEKALKHRLGLSLEPTQGAIDIHDGIHDGDDKYLGESVGSFRTGKLGKRLYVRCLRLLPDDVVTDEMLDGEIGPGKLFNSLPDDVKSKLQNDLRPEVGLACYPSLYLTNARGFIKVMAVDYTQAFSLATITQYAPKYKLKREYVETQLLTTLSVPKDAADVAA